MIAVTDTTALAINRLIAAAGRRIRGPASSVGRLHRPRAAPPIGRLTVVCTAGSVLARRPSPRTVCNADATSCSSGHAGPVVMHPHHVVVTVDTVSRSVAEQFPRWVDLPIREVASHGTVNALFRIGDRFAARFPLEPGDVEGKLRWLTSEAQAAGSCSGARGSRRLNRSP